MLAIHAPSVATGAFCDVSDNMAVHCLFRVDLPELTRVVMARYTGPLEVLFRQEEIVGVCYCGTEC